MATRVFELAKELGVTSKTIIDKCRAEDLIIKNHMATLSVGLEATIREWFSEGANATAVETSQHVDLASARQDARRARRRKDEPGFEGESELAEGSDVAVEEQPPVEEIVVEQAEPPAQEPAEQPVAQQEAAPEQAVQAPAVPVEAEAQPMPAPVEATQVVAAPEVSAEPATAPQPVAEAPTPAPAEPPTPPVAGAPTGAPPRPEVRPAGPQLIPRPAKLTGPRVVRVEKPDFVMRAPPRRRPPTTSAPGAAPGATIPAPPSAPKRFTGIKKPMTVADEEEEKRKKAAAAAKRSPRRRGGRSADSGETNREWRDRDLEERNARLAAATGGLRRHRPGVSQGGGAGSPLLRPGRLPVEEPITVKTLSAATGIKSAQIIRKLIEMGTMATVNQVIGRDQASAVMLNFDIELEVIRSKSAEERLADDWAGRIKGDQVTRAPVVTFLGHVDHGKTSLLDRIRNATVASGEAGGITQHIGAYRYDLGDKHVVFLDTPGHEAFTAMRARGANMTDVVVLVVAADDGVMPQTIEALSHAKAAKVPIVIALNKIDVPNANPTRALGQLAEHGLQPREWGGNVEVIRTSAMTGEGINELVETLSLEAEILELKAEPQAPASGYVIEAHMDPGLGNVARLLVRDGTLKVGDVLLAGGAYGRIRQMVDSFGRPLEEAGPSTPVAVSGLDEVPEAGDRFFVLQDAEEAREIAEDRRARSRTASLAQAPGRTLESLLSKIEAGDANELNLIIKADMQGSVEALTGTLNKLSTDEVRVNILHSAVGGISTGDVMLAEASDALIIGFNVVADASTRSLAEAQGVDIRTYQIIYEIVEDIRKALEEGLAPEIRQEILGHADVRQVFKVSRTGSIAGCFVTDGTINRNLKLRIIRNNVVVEDERSLESLKRFKDDVREVRNGMECGLKIAGYDDIKEGDVLEFYQKVSVARKL